MLDLFSRRVIGWAMSAPQDETLIETALRMALLGRHPSAGLLFHSDRGPQATSDAYRATLAEVGITVSMSRTGNCGECGRRILFRDAEGRMCGTRVFADLRVGQPNHRGEYVECFTTEFSGTAHLAMFVRLLMHNLCVNPNVSGLH